MILFLDLDDTLVPSSLAYDFGLKQLGIAANDARFLAARAQVKDLCPPGYPACRSRRLYFKRYLEIGGEFSPRRHSEMVWIYENGVNEFIGRAWFELDRPRLMEDLRKRSNKICLVSNETLAAQVGKLEQMDPEWRFFDHLVTSEEVAVEKPDAKIFRRAIELSGAKESDVLMVGDNLELDFKAALALGFRALQTIEFHSGDEKRADVFIEKLDSLPKFIDSHS